MANAPFPVVVSDSGNTDDAPSSAFPVALYLSPILQALADAGFGTDGQVLTMDGTDGFKWTTP